MNLKWAPFLSIVLFVTVVTSAWHFHEDESEGVEGNYCSFCLSSSQSKEIVPSACEQNFDANEIRILSFIKLEEIESHYNFLLLETINIRGPPTLV